jgi:sRNA-binding protein
MLNLTRLHLGIAHESQFQGLGIRRPLKRNILVDLEQAGFPAAHELIAAAVDWYQGHFGYLFALQAGAKRLDLDGKEVSTVTESEQDAALKKIKEGQKAFIERNEHNATKTLATLRAARRIPDDQLRKLEAPPMKVPSELTRLHEALAAADAAWAGPGDTGLRTALTSAALTVVIKEAQSLINSFTNATQAETASPDKPPL